MSNISLSLIVKDEPADRLAMLCEYMQPVVSQIVIADTGSENNQIDLYNTWNKVEAFNHEWKDSFAEARNSTLERIPEDNWVMRLDADELPSVVMMAHLATIVERDEKRPLAWSYFSVNYWAGERGPEEDYHWHTHLFKRKVGKWYKPVHEQVELRGQPEHVAYARGWILRAPREAYLIHAKPLMHFERANTLYPKLGGGSRY